MDLLFRFAFPKLGEVGIESHVFVDVILRISRRGRAKVIGTVNVR